MELLVRHVLSVLEILYISIIMLEMLLNYYGLCCILLEIHFFIVCVAFYWKFNFLPIFFSLIFYDIRIYLIYCLSLQSVIKRHYRVNEVDQTCNFLRHIFRPIRWGQISYLRQWWPLQINLPAWKNTWQER